MATETITEKIAKYFSILILAVAIVFITYLEERIIGYSILLAGALSLYMTETGVAKRILLVYTSLALLFGVLILHDMSLIQNWMTATLGVFGVALPILMARFIYGQDNLKQYFIDSNDGFSRYVWRAIIVAIFAYAVWTLIAFKR